MEPRSFTFYTEIDGKRLGDGYFIVKGERDEDGAYTKWNGNLSFFAYQEIESYNSLEITEVGVYDFRFNPDVGGSPRFIFSISNHMPGKEFNVTTDMGDGIHPTIVKYGFNPDFNDPKPSEIYLSFPVEMGPL